MRRGSRVKPLVYMSLPVPCPDAQVLRKQAIGGVKLGHTSVTKEAQLACIIVTPSNGNIGGRSV